MGRIRFASTLQRHVTCPPGPVRGGCVREALDAAFAENPRLRGYVLDDQGRLRRHVNVFVNDRPVADRMRLGDPVGPGDDIHVIQALSGG